MSFAMIFANIGNSAAVAMAAEGNGGRVEFQMSREDVWAAAKEAVRAGGGISAENFNFTQGDAEGVRALFAGGRLFEITNGVKYEAYPDTEGAELRVFIRIPGDGDPENYQLTGEEKLVFMYMNSGEEDLRASVKIVGEESGEIAVNTGEILVESWQEAFGESRKKDGENLSGQMSAPAQGSQNGAGKEAAGSTDSAGSEETSAGVENAVGEETTAREENAVGEETTAGEENAVGEETTVGEENTTGEETTVGAENMGGEETAAGEDGSVHDETGADEADGKTEIEIGTGTEAGAGEDANSTDSGTLDNAEVSGEESNKAEQDNGDISSETGEEVKVETEVKPGSEAGTEAEENGTSHEHDEASVEKSEAPAEKAEAAPEHSGKDVKEPEKADGAEEKTIEKTEGKTEEKSKDAEKASDRSADKDSSSDTSGSDGNDENKETAKLSKSENQVRVVAESAEDKYGLVALGENTTARVIVMKLSATGFAAEGEEGIPADVPEEVKKFLEAVKELPVPEAVTKEDAEEIIEKLYSETLSDGYALTINSDEPWTQREDVKAACVKYEVTFAAAEKVLKLEEAGTFETKIDKNKSLFGRDYHIYEQNVVDELNRRTLNLNITVPVGETVIDEGVFRFWDMSYGVYNVSSWDDFDIWSTNEDVLKVKAVPNGKSLKIIYEGIADGTAQIKMAFNLTTISTGEGSIWGAGNWGGAACANCTVGTMTVGNGTGNGKPAKPTVNDVPTANQDGYVYIKCVTYPNTDPTNKWNRTHAGYMRLRNSTNGWSFGEIYSNDGRFGDELPTNDYPWFCDLTIDKDWYLKQWNFNYSYAESVHYLANDAPVTMTFVSDGEDWYYFEEDVPLVVWITHEKPVDPTYAVTYTDGVAGEVVFPDQGYEGLKVKDKTPEFKGIPSRDGYTFMGWAPAVNPVVSADDANDKNEIIYTATWKKNEEKPTPTTYTVIYTDGVKGEIVFPDQGYEDLKVKDKTPEFKGTPSRDGYTFMGWAPAVNPVVSADDANDKNEIIYTATWKKNEEKPTPTTYTVIYTDGVKGEIVFPDQGYEDLKVDDNTPAFVGETGEPSSPTCDGYTFKGWSPEVKEKVKAEDANDKGEIIYTATWEKNEEEKPTPTTYTIIYTDGVENETVFDEQRHEGLKVDDNTPAFVGETGEPSSPTCDGYTFKGWSPEVKEKVKAEDANDKGEIIYTATWEKNGAKPTPKLVVTKKNDGFKVDNKTGKATVDYTVTVTNVSGFDIYGLRITDELDEPTLEKVNAADIGKPSITYSFKDFKIDKGDGNGPSKASLKSGGANDLIHVLEPLDRNEEFKDNQKVTLTYTIEIENANDDVEVKVTLYNKVKGASWSKLSGTAPQGRKSRAAAMLLADAADSDEPDVDGEASSSTGGEISDSGSSDTEGTIPRKYRVSYTWNLPEGADEKLPETEKYFKDTLVTVDNDYTSSTKITVDGKTYTFSGWSTEDGEIRDAVENGEFTMPARNVVIKGTWTPDNPGPDKPDPDNPEPENPDPDKPDPDKPEPDNPGPDNPTPDNPKPDNPTPDIPNPETHKVTVHYIYADGSRAADDAVRDNLTEGTTYSITSPGISGYTPDQSIVNGTMGTEDVEITVTYTRNSSGNSGGGGSNGGGGGGGSRTTNIRGRALGSTPDSEPDVPVAEVPDEDVPLANIPVDIPDADVPLAGIVQWNIPDDDVPLAAVPRTGDSSGVWHMMAILSAFGLMAMSLLDKKKRQE